jgi:uncharacterized SAM-binding protein YcdF (DUF218 family)
MMKIIGSIFLVIIIFAVCLGIYLQPNDLALCPLQKPSTRGGCTTVDAIIAVSGGDTVARTNHAIDLYKNGWAPFLIFSGAAQDKTGPSNARTMRETALNAGVPSTAILIEEDSENTKQNAENTNRLLTANNIKQVILVTSGYHQRRASLEFGKIVGNTVAVQNSPTNDKDWDWWWWLTPRGWWLALGEVVKIIAFHTGA